jgi:ABC-type transport system substrate-binding protein
VRVSGKFYGKRTDQILPPSLQGYREATLYPIKGADPTKARQLSGGAGNTVTIIHSTTALRTAQAQVLKFNLEQMGLKAETRPLPFAVALRTVGTRGADFDAYVGGWVADYPDPFDFINVLLDGNNIQESNNNNYAYFNDARFNKQMNDFAKLSGPNRYASYGKLDVDLMRNAAPWAPFATPNSREFVSAAHHQLHPPPGLRRRGHQRARDQVGHPYSGGAFRRPARLRSRSRERPVVLQYLIRRVLWAMVLFLAVTIVTYVIFYVTPSDPARLAAGQGATPADVQARRRAAPSR